MLELRHFMIFLENKKVRIKAVKLKHKLGQTELVKVKRKINKKVYMSQLFKVQVMISG